MEKGYRIVQCPPPCGQKLRLTITKAHYGKRYDVKCPKCFLVFETIIPVPEANTDEQIFQSDPLKDDPLSDRVEKSFEDALREADEITNKWLEKLGVKRRR